MDIRNNKNIFHSKIKPFTLKATASAILAFNAETVFAAPCPAEIFGTLAGICEFTATSSVTVENGGTVGGILMDGQAPSSSFIAVNSGGTISGTGTGIGINISNGSSLTNGLSNNGTISSTSSTGIKVSNISTVSGGISNSGLISAGLVGIDVDHSTINGDIFNTGSILSNTNGTGILIAHSTINGGILNSGTISGSDVDSGITIGNNSIITGDITNAGLINAVDGNALIISNSIIAGGISNTSRIESSGGDGIAIVNVSTIQSNLTNSGTINGGNQGIEVLSRSAINGGISNGGTINGGVAGIYINTSTTSGSITNSGTISGGATGISIIFTQARISGGISNSGIISGGLIGISIFSNATVDGGISNSGTIRGDNYAINISNSTVGNIDILGETARIIGAVTASSTAVNITNGAVFTSEGNYTVRSFNIAQNAVFNMANTVTITDGFNNAGTLAITDSTQTITGDYTQNTGGIFQTSVLSATDYGQLIVTGTADLSQSGDIYVKTQQNTALHVGDVLSDVISGNPVVSTNGFSVSSNSYIWDFVASLNNANTSVNLTTVINPAAYTVCQGAYCQGAADTIIGQVAAGNSLFGAYTTLSTATALQTAASQATPELTNENIQMIQLITRAVVDIVPMWSSLRGKSAGDATLYQPGKIWVKPYGASMAQTARNTVNGFDATAYGAVIGKDIELSNDWLFGGAFAAGGDNMQGKSVLSGQSINSSAYQGMLYGAKKLPNQCYVAGQGLVGYEINNTSRAIPLYASTAKGSYNSWFTNIRAEAGWSTSVFSPDFVLTPEIDASYVFINQGSYQESGSPMDLSVATNNNSSLVLGAYGNGAYHLTSTKHQNDLTLNGYAGLAGDVLNNQPQTISTFVAGGSSFSTFGVQFNGLVFRGGAGLTVTNPTKPFILELNYDVQAGNNAYSGIGAATIKYKL